MSGYSPKTHFTCATCKRRLPLSKAQKGKLLCKDRKGCIDEAARAYANLPAWPSGTTRP